MYTDITLILHISLRRHIPTDVVGVERIRSHANRPVGTALGRMARLAKAIMFSHNVFAHHSPPFAHVDTVRPSSVVYELVLGKPPFRHPKANFLWH